MLVNFFIDIYTEYLLKWHLIYLIIVIEAVEGGQAVKRYLIKGDLYVRFSANV